MGLNYYASSPTVVLPPQQPQGYFSHHQRAHSPSAMGNFRPKYPTPPSLNYLAAVSNATAGRKRSIADVDDPEENQPVGSIVTPLPVKPKPEPIYGPGMTLIYPDEPGFCLAAESQSGTWCEEKNEKEEKAEPVRPIAVSRKSVRMSPSANVAIPSLNDMDASKTEGVIDENGNTINTLIASLGVGWKNVMTNPNLRDAARAYSRVIERHFDLTDALVMLEKESLSAYLVRAKQHGVQGYWLFSDSLQWCQLVGWSLERTVSNLMFGPTPRVEGERINARHLTPTEPATSQPVVDTPVAVAEADAMEL
ncbi:Nn.00g013660.m01.CDS01 [Neocucurbitaria sp. VM-36]